MSLTNGNGRPTERWFDRLDDATHARFQAFVDGGGTGRTSIDWVAGKARGREVVDKGRIGPIASSARLGKVDVEAGIS